METFWHSQPNCRSTKLPAVNCFGVKREEHCIGDVTLRVHTTVHAAWRDVDREREFNTCWEQSMMGAVSEVTVSIDGRMEPARTRGDGSPMLPQSHEQFRSGTSKSWSSSSGSKHGKRIEKASSAHFPFCFRRRKGASSWRPAMRGKRSTQLEMAKRAHRKTCPSFALHTGQNSARILMEELPIQ